MTPDGDKLDQRTAAEAELEQRRDPGGDDALEDQAREEKKRRRAELSSGKGGPTSASQVLKGDPAAQRTRNKNAKPVNALVDNMTARDGSDAIEGGYVTIDYSKDSTVKMVKDQLAPKGSPLDEQGFEPGPHSADRGAYLGPGEVGDDGYPKTARVHLHDEHAAIILVPYDALRRATAGGRR